MAVITAPSELAVSSFRWSLLYNDIESRSVFGAQALRAAAPLWVCSMTGILEQDTFLQQNEAFLESLDGKRNQLALWHIGRPAPMGTMRGSWTLAAQINPGDTSFNINGGVSQANRTLRKGDLFGLGSGLTQQVFRVVADATANAAGVIFLQTTQPSRSLFANNAVVTWDKPTALFRQNTVTQGGEYVPGLIGQGWTLDLIEDWRP